MSLGVMPFKIPSNQPPEPSTPAWVHLEALAPRPDADHRRVTPDGLDWTGRVRGELHRWWRTAEGTWLGQVTYVLGYADGRDHWIRVEDQLLPATALSPRDDGKSIRLSAHPLSQPNGHPLQEHELHADAGRPTRNR
jgi:hypothetical protein